MNCIYQFFNFTSSENIFEKVLKINHGGAVAVFDLEDSFLIPFNKKKSVKLKALARKTIADFIESSNTDKLKLGIRINHCDTNDFKRDLSLLKKYNNIKWSCVFLPKVEDNNCIYKYREALQKSKIGYKNLIPIIESKKGLSNINKICRYSHKNNISEIAFGHCDYNLDTGIFPFMHLDNPKLLSIIKYFIKAINKYSLEYVNTPYLKLNDSKGYTNILRNIYNIVGKEFSQVTLCKEQSRICKSIKDNSKETLIPFTSQYYDVEEYAKAIINTHNANILNGKGFAINGNRVAYSPHEYIAAKKYLDKKK